MGLLSFLLGIFGFGIGIPIGFLIAFFIFVHSDATEIKENIFSTLSFTPSFFFTIFYASLFYHFAVTCMLILSMIIYLIFMFLFSGYKYEYRSCLEILNFSRKNY